MLLKSEVIQTGSVYGTFNLMDSNPSAVHIVDYASLPSGGVITGGKLYGGVYIHDNCTFTMESGPISGNSADYGGGVYNRGTFTMTGGKITGNTAEDDGGGVENSGRQSTGALDRKKLKLSVLP